MAVGVQVPLRVRNAGIAQLVEHDLAKVGVASSSLVSRSKNLGTHVPGFFYARSPRLSAAPNPLQPSSFYCLLSETKNVF
jgi:hypothetical protein